MFNYTVYTVKRHSPRLMRPLIIFIIHPNILFSA